MVNSSNLLRSFFVIVWLLILPIAQATDIELSDVCSLADAITAANTDEAAGGCPAGDGVDTISLSEDITLVAALPQITTEITIEGSEHTISGDDRFRIFVVNGGNLTINELILTNGFGDWGGAIANLNGVLHISSSSIWNCSAVEGGAIGSDGLITIVTSDFMNNQAELGGAIHSIAGSLQIHDSHFAHNVSSGHAGAAFHSGEVFKISASSFESNSADESGGAVFVSFTESTGLHIVDTKFLYNEARYHGGAIHTTEERGGIRFIIQEGSDFSALMTVASPVIRINNSDFQYNRADSAGGAIGNSVDAGIQVSNSQFMYNSSRIGGALSTDEGHSLVENSKFDHNSSTSSGGAISVGTYTKLGIVESILSANSAGEEGGAVRVSTGDLAVGSSTFHGNSATLDGGAIYVGPDGDASIRHSTLSNNSADRGGGLFRSADAVVFLKSSVIANSVGGDCFGRLAQNINNLIADGSCFATITGDPMLGELVEPEDGSPAYYPLLEGSPAIDAADDEFCPDTDIVGTPRPQGAACDIGAFEYTGPAND